MGAAPADTAEDFIQFAQGVNKLKKALDRRAGAILTADDVAGLIWGIQVLRKGSEHAAADPA